MRTTITKEIEVEVELDDDDIKEILEGLSREDVEGAKVRAEGQQQLVSRLRQLRAAGRIVLELPSETPQLKDLPEGTHVVINVK